MDSECFDCIHWILFIILPYSSSQPIWAPVLLFSASSQSCNGLKYSNIGDASIFRESVRISSASGHFTDEPSASISLRDNNTKIDQWMNDCLLNANQLTWRHFQRWYFHKYRNCSESFSNYRAHIRQPWCMHLYGIGIERWTKQGICRLQQNRKWVWHFVTIHWWNMSLTSDIQHRQPRDIWLVHRNPFRFVALVAECPNIRVVISRNDNCIRLVWFHREKFPIEIGPCWRQMARRQFCATPFRITDWWWTLRQTCNPSADRFFPDALVWIRIRQGHRQRLHGIRDWRHHDIEPAGFCIAGNTGCGRARDVRWESLACWFGYTVWFWMFRDKFLYD